MPRATARNKTANPLTSELNLPAGLDVTTAVTNASGRGRGAQRTGNARPGQPATLQFLSLPRENANQVIGTVKASTLANFVNMICTVESAHPGFIAENPAWAYTIGSKMFATE